MRVTGGPEWINRTAFAVDAVASREATAQQRRLMLQTLLEERFALTFRNATETPDTPMGNMLALASLLVPRCPLLFESNGDYVSCPARAG